MIKLENVEITGWEAAIRGMRNPMNSWEKSDSEFDGDPWSCQSGGGSCPNFGSCACYIGKNDLDLMTRLRNSGIDHRKFMRMIIVYLDIFAPLYW